MHDGGTAAHPERSVEVEDTQPAQGDHTPNGGVLRSAPIEVKGCGFSHYLQSFSPSSLRDNRQSELGGTGETEATATSSREAAPAFPESPIRDHRAGTEFLCLLEATLQP